MIVLLPLKYLAFMGTNHIDMGMQHFAMSKKHYSDTVKVVASYCLDTDPKKKKKKSCSLFRGRTKFKVNEKGTKGDNVSYSEDKDLLS